jgi:hypothetical protein
VPSSPRKGGHHEEDPGSQVRAGPPDQRLHAGVRRRSLLPALGPAPCPVPSRPWKGGHHEEDPGSQDRAGPPDQRLHAGIRRRSLLRIAGAAGAGAGAVRLARTAPADGPRIAVPCPQATCVHAPRLQTRLQTPLANALASDALAARAWNTALATARLQHRACNTALAATWRSCYYARAWRDSECRPGTACGFPARPETDSDMSYAISRKGGTDHEKAPEFRFPGREYPVSGSLVGRFPPCRGSAGARIKWHRNWITR